jgi:hypothetical protein
MELLAWTVSAVGSAAIGIVLTLLFGDALKNATFSLMSKLSLHDEDGLNGVWIATFYYPHPDTGASTPFTEAIRLEERLGMVTGRVVDDPHNTPREGRAKSKNPVRLRGQLKDNNYLSGIWLHPSRQAHYHGSFQLIVYPSGNDLRGQWIGFSQTKNEVVADRWEWVRAE